MTALKIMVVDDSRTAVELLSVLLHELGHEVVRVSGSGADAVRDYDLVRPDVVAMDITMPGMDGIAATAAIREHDADARVIMVTSHGQELMVVRAIDAGACGYVLKPINKDKLAAMLARATRPD